MTVAAVEDGRDTIFALSSGTPPAGIAVVRVSGPATAATLTMLAGSLPVPRRATLRTLRDAGGRDAGGRDVGAGIVDRALVLWFPGPGTATGEDLAELHLHGGRAVVARALAVLGDRPGLRAALPGEFTRRAFLNGRIDLLQAEGLADLLSAETEQQRRAAIGMADGRFSDEVEHWRARLLRIAAMVEASLDFGDEDDVAASRFDRAGAIEALAGEIEAALRRPSAERLRDGVRVVLAGPPNAGKSSLLNILVGRDAAIVSPIAGTTRDLVEVPVAIEGVPFLFCDTAGLHEADDAIERLGIERARSRIAEAELLLWLGEDAPPAVSARTAWLWPRADLRAGDAPAGRLAVSVRAATGIDAVLAWLLAEARRLLPKESEAAISRRQEQELAKLAAALRRATTVDDVILVAEELRDALLAVDRLTGKAGLEDLLDAIFGQFCLGK